MAHITTDHFGTLDDGREVTRWKIVTDNGSSLEVINFGAIITTLTAPDRDGVLKDVVLGFDAPQPYFEDAACFGAVVGRYANRIKGGRFTLDGKTYDLAINNGPHSLHGGAVGFDKVIWDGDAVETDDGPGVRLAYRAADGEEGYPGNLMVSVTYVFTPDGTLIIDTEATTDAPTVINIAQHSYFNLAGHDARSVLDQTMMINADFFTPVDETLIPTGEIRKVAGTPLDFTAPKLIREGIDDTDPQIRFGGGLDHNFVLRRASLPDALALAAVVTDPQSGRQLRVLTDQPGIQVYSGNALDGTVAGKGGVAYPRRSAVALETQHFPDSPNQPHFPPTTLVPGETFASRTVYAFGVEA